jgi:hypothetical protein
VHNTTLSALKPVISLDRAKFSAKSPAESGFWTSRS